mmetsp:Transcript_33946/g.79256  ORF Transcript_33946/g.79256 Transcript_33946/m.79256 type:complete len:261 (-) Transcript_33946:166-948(-)
MLACLRHALRHMATSSMPSNRRPSAFLSPQASSTPTAPSFPPSRQMSTQRRSCPAPRCLRSSPSSKLRCAPFKPSRTSWALPRRTPLPPWPLPNRPLPVRPSPPPPPPPRRAVPWPSASGSAAPVLSEPTAPGPLVRRASLQGQQFAEVYQLVDAVAGSLQAALLQALLAAAAVTNVLATTLVPCVPKAPTATRLLTTATWTRRCAPISIRASIKPRRPRSGARGAPATATLTPDMATKSTQPSGVRLSSNPAALSKAPG